jgi:hypothetical protein
VEAPAERLEATEHALQRAIHTPLTSQQSGGGCLPCRSRQHDRQRIAAQHHHQYEPPNRPLTVSVGAKKLGDAADGRSLGLDLPALGRRTVGMMAEISTGLPFFAARQGSNRKCFAS